MGVRATDTDAEENRGGWLMGTVTVTTAGKAAPAGHKRVTLKLGTELLTLPVTSEVVPHSDFSPLWAEIPTTGVPLLRAQGERLRKMQLTVVFVLPGGMTSVEGGLVILHRFANHEKPVLVLYSLFESGYWRITDWPMKSVRKHPITGETVRAEVTLMLTREPNPPPITAPKPPSHPPPPRPVHVPKGKPGGAAPQKYTVRAGDTLAGIAARFYGDADLWPQIAQANKIRDPRRLRIGQVLTIPPRHA